MTDDDLTPEELAAQEAGPLPDREALSLLSGGGSSSLLGGALLGDTPTDTSGAVPSGTLGPDGTIPTDEHPHAEASADDGTSYTPPNAVSSEPRDDTFTSTDTKSA